MASQRHMTWAVVAALAVVGGLLAMPEPSDPTDPEGDDVTLWSVAPETIEAITIDRTLPTAGGRERRDVSLSLQGNEWVLTEPLSDAADPDMVRALFRLLSAQRGEKVDGALDPEEYGLGDPPVARVTVRLASGLERELWVGAKVPTTYASYARVPGGPVLMVAGDGHRVVTEHVDGFRDHRMFDVDPARVRHVELFGPEGRLVIAGEGHAWGLRGWGRVDANAVDDVVMGLLDLRYDRVWEETNWVESPDYGAVLREEGGREVRLHVGEDTPLGRVASTSDGRFGTLFSELVQQLGRGPRSVLDPHALPLSMERADRVRIELDGQSVDARRSGPQWAIPGMDPGDAFLAVEALSEAPAVYRRDRPEGPFDAGIIVIEEEGGGTHSLRLGAPLGSERPVLDEAHPWPYRMNEADLQAFLAAAG